MSKSIIDDGFRHELVENALFTGTYEIPEIQPLPDTVPLPEKLLPFDKRRLSDNYRQWIHFYLFDKRFQQLITSTERYLGELACFDGVITPDASLYRDMPVAVQIANTYLNRAVGHYLQRNGIPVICNVRWSTKASYAFAFDGAPVHSTLAVSTHGCLKGKENKYYFEAGLAEMMTRLEPKRVVVYGVMPDSIFSPYANAVQFAHYPSNFATTHGVV